MDTTNSNQPKIPAWKLRRQLIQQNNKVPKALYVDGNVNSELGSSRSASRPKPTLLQQHLRNSQPRKSKSTGSISGSTMSTSSLSTYGSNSRSSNASCHVSRTIRVSRVPGTLDPTVPPAYRAAWKLQQQQREKNNTNCLASSVASHSRTVQTDYDSDVSSLDSDDEHDDEDSFASVDSQANEDDDEAYQLSRNQMASFTFETTSPRRTKSRFQKKTMGVHGTPLGLIAE